MISVDRSLAIVLMRALVMTLSCYGTLEIVCVLLLLLLTILKLAIKLNYKTCTF